MHCLCAAQSKGWNARELGWVTLVPLLAGDNGAVRWVGERHAHPSDANGHVYICVCVFVCVCLSDTANQF